MILKSLDNLKPGETGQIHELPDGKRVHSRLSEMGLRVGMMISVKSHMPLKGPILIMAGQTQIALGHGTANRIIIKLR